MYSKLQLGCSIALELILNDYPGKSFGLKFIPNQSDLFRNLFPRQSELIRVNP